MTEIRVNKSELKKKIVWTEKPLNVQRKQKIRGAFPGKVKAIWNLKDAYLSNR